MAKPLPTSIRLDPELKSALEKAATADGRSLANFIDRILREWLTNAAHTESRSKKVAKEPPQVPDITIVGVEAKDGRPTGKTASFKLTKEGLKPE